MSTTEGRHSKKFKDAVLSYKYVSPSMSILEQLYLNDLWGKAVYLFPMWVAPNVITLIGFSFILAAYGLTYVNSPLLMGELEPWQYIFTGTMYFLYQTFDGMDGKQARRTQSGSALGELMDHGIDAVVTTFVVVITTDVYAFGYLSIYPWIFIVSANLSFFLSNLALVHAGKQNFFILDVMEMQTAMILCILLAGVGGPEFLTDLQIPLPSFMHTIKTDLYGLLKPDEIIDFTTGYISMKMLIVVLGISGCVINYPQYTYSAFRPYLLPDAEKPQNIKDKATGTGILNVLFHLFLIHAFSGLSMAVIWFSLQIPNPDRALVVLRYLPLLFAFSFGDFMNRMLVLRVAREPIGLMPTGFLPLILYTIASYHDKSILGLETEFGIPPCLIYTCITALTLVIHLSYFSGIVRDLSRVLGVHPFLVRKVKK